MFLDALVRRNRPLIEAAIQLHQAGRIPANSYVIDLDAVTANSRRFADEAARRNLDVLAMTKQMGRNPNFLNAVSDGGIARFVAVDMADARRIHECGHSVGHIGHLVQVPKHEAPEAAAMSPDYWTVYSEDKAREAASAAKQAGLTQDFLARIHAEGDTFYKGHEGGFPADRLSHVAGFLDSLEGGRFAGVTSFPALLFDPDSGTARPTHNLGTLVSAAEVLAHERRNDIMVNAPGTTSTEVLQMLADAGATQVEPGHGLTGTTPLHAMRDLPEVPAVLYLSEVSHFVSGRAYCFGGGLYIDPVFPSYQVRALVGSDPEGAQGVAVPAELPSSDAIDYYGMLDVPEGKRVATGDTVIFGFRIQAFVTRAFVAPLSGVSSGSPRVQGVWHSDGAKASRPSEDGSD